MPQRHGAAVCIEQSKLGCLISYLGRIARNWHQLANQVGHLAEKSNNYQTYGEQNPPRALAAVQLRFAADSPDPVNQEPSCHCEEH